MDDWLEGWNSDGWQQSYWRLTQNTFLALTLSTAINGLPQMIPEQTARDTSPYAPGVLRNSWPMHVFEPLDWYLWHPNLKLFCTHMYVYGASLGWSLLWSWCQGAAASNPFSLHFFCCHSCVVIIGILLLCWGTLLHLQKGLQCYLVELTPSIILYPP
jgi:hypothetical protein